MTPKKPAPRKRKPPRINTNDRNFVPTLMELGARQEAARVLRAAQEAERPVESTTRAAVRPSSEPLWGYSFELHPSLPESEREALTAFFSQFTTLNGSYAILVVGPDTPVEDRRKAWDSNRSLLEIEQLRAHMPPLDEAARTERLQRALAAPVDGRWSEAAMLLSTWDQATLPAAIALADRALARWPDRARFELPAWKDRPELLRLCRTAWGPLNEVSTRKELASATVLATQDAKALKSHQPELSHVRHLALSGVEGLGAVVLGCKALTRLEVLELQQPTYSKGTQPLELKKLLKAKHLRGLDALSLYGYTLSDESLAALAKCEQPLTRLRIEYGRLTPGAATALAALASRRRLVSLQVKFNELGPRGAQTLFGARDDWGALKVLDLSANEIGDEGAQALAEAGATELRWLCLSSNAQQQQLTARAARSLAESRALGKLHSLFLNGQPLGAEGIAALLESDALRGLRTLNVSYASSSFKDLCGACGSGGPAELEVLNLGGLDSSKKADWTRARFLKTVKVLCLDALQGINYEGFFACPHLGSLETLVLGGCFAGADQAVEAIARAAPLPSLRYIDMSGWKPTPEQARVMARSPLFQGVWGVEFMTSYLTPEAWREFDRAGVPMVHGGFNRIPASEYGSLTTFRDEWI